MMRFQPTRIKEWVAVALSLALLCGASIDRASLAPARDPSPYHQAVRAAAAQTPLRFGNWAGVDWEVPVEAARQLHPNVLISRQYTNTVTGRRVGLLLVQCGDVRDLTPHYPPVCYPGRGLTLIATRNKDWSTAGLAIQGTEYQFESNTFQTSALTIVENFMVLPDGRFCRNMDDVRREAGMNTRYFGAAQVQVVMDSDVPDAERDRICCEFVAAYAPLIGAIRSGVE